MATAPSSAIRTAATGSLNLFASVQNSVFHTLKQCTRMLLQYHMVPNESDRWSQANCSCNRQPTVSPFVQLIQQNNVINYECIGPLVGTGSLTCNRHLVDSQLQVPLFLCKIINSCDNNGDY